MAKKQHYSARGAVVNFDELSRKNSKVIAVGNGRMNARGDRLGAGGKIIRKIEDVPINKLPRSDHEYATNPKKAIKLASLKDNMQDMIKSKGTKKSLRDLDPKEAKTPGDFEKDRISKTSNITENKTSNLEVDLDSDQIEDVKTETKTESKRKIVDSEE